MVNLEIQLLFGNCAALGRLAQADKEAVVESTTEMESEASATRGG